MRGIVINKDIEEYEHDIWKGFSARQLIFGGLSVGAATALILFAYLVCYVLYDDEWAWVHVDEISRAHLLGLKQKRTPDMAGSYNIKGTVIRFPDLIAYVKKLIPGAEITMDHGSRGLKNWNLDMSVTERELGYVQQKDVWESIKDTINEVRRIHNLPEVG